MEHLVLCNLPGVPPTAWKEKNQDKFSKLGALRCFKFDQRYCLTRFLLFLVCIIKRVPYTLWFGGKFIYLFIYYPKWLLYGENEISIYVKLYVQRAKVPQKITSIVGNTVLWFRTCKPVREKRESSVPKWTSLLKIAPLRNSLLQSAAGLTKFENLNKTFVWSN